MYPAARKPEKHPLPESCLPKKFSILSLSMKNRTPVKNKHPAVFPTALWSHFSSSGPSVAISPSHTLLCDVGDGTLTTTACSARASGGGQEDLRRKDAVPVHVTQLCFFTLALAILSRSGGWSQFAGFPASTDQPHLSPLQMHQCQASWQPYYGMKCVHKIHLLIP